MGLFFFCGKVYIVMYFFVYIRFHGSPDKSGGKIYRVSHQNLILQTRDNKN